MEQQYIDMLWHRTNENIVRMRHETDDDKLREKMGRFSQYRPQPLPADLFLKDDRPVFISFHDAEGNANKHYHDFFEMNYVVKGNPIGVIDNHDLAMAQGGLCLMNPNAVHYYESYDAVEDLILNIVLPKTTFEKHFFLPMLSDPILNAFFLRYSMASNDQPSFIYIPTLGRHGQSLIEMLVKEYLEQPHYTQTVTESIITLLFALIMRGYEQQGYEPTRPIEKILTYMYEHYRDCDLKALAAHFGYHPKYLSSLIHKETGQTYRDLMTQIRLKSSEHYLLYTDYNMDQIVTAIGYKEKSSFYTSFKKQYKESPGHYRRRHRKKA